MKGAIDFQLGMGAEHDPGGVEEIEVRTGDVTAQGAIDPRGLSARDPANHVGDGSGAGKGGAPQSLDTELPEAMK
jgi:hypothetical protein